MSERKMMAAEELRTAGYLQEANRRFFHPLGLALQVDMETGALAVWDERDDSEGVCFADGVLDHAKAEHVQAEQTRRAPERTAALGYVVQPVWGP